MPVEIHAPADRPAASKSDTRGADLAAPDLVIGIINNMPDSALRSTERQFGSLLAAASGSRRIELRYSSIPEVPRGAEASERVLDAYWPLAKLLDARLDGLIVTGNEPRAASLRDEPYWARLGEILAFAEGHVPSSIWSCLAAHAAVLQLDGIERRRLAKKRSGVYTHELSCDHQLAAGLPDSLPTPHSRWNDLAEGDLVRAGYQILAASPSNGVDVFLRQRASLLVFLQGHPEYEPETLLREYRRDVKRFVDDEISQFPDIPTGYLSAAAEQALLEFRDRALSRSSRSIADLFPYEAAASGIDNRWRPPAVRFYRNWLDWLATNRRR